MALNGWLSKAPITIAGSRLSTTVTNFPMLMIGSNFPSQIFTTSAGCLSGGGDIRFALSSDGSNELPRDIVNINKTTSTLSVYVKVPTISAGGPTTIYCFWNNSNASEPGLGSPSQKELVWSDYYGVLHFQNMTSAWKGVKDISTSWNSCSTAGTLASAVGHANGLTAAAMSTTFGITVNELINFASLTNDLMFWCYQPTLMAGSICTGTNGIPFGFLAAGQWGIGWGLTSTTSNALTAATWQHICMRNVAGTCNIYVNGVNKTQGTGTAQASNFTALNTVGATAPVFNMSEFRMTRNNSIPIANIAGMYVCESAPNLFTSPGTVETVAASNTLTFTGLQTSSEIRIYVAGTQTELAGIEYTGNTWSWDFDTVQPIDIAIVSIQYEDIRYENFALTNSDITIPIQQRFDRNYYNP